LSVPSHIPAQFTLSSTKANVTHVILRGSKREMDPVATPIGDVNPKERIQLTVGIVGPRLPGPGEYVGRTLSPRKFGKRFSATKADAAKVARSLRKYGLKVRKASLMTRSIRVSGTAAAIEAAFMPKMKIMQSASGGQYRGRQGTCKIPNELKGIVTGVFGLDQRFMAQRRAVTVVAPKSAAPTLSLDPAEIEVRYGFPEGDGAGQKIAIAEFGGGYFPKDTIAYCRKFGRSVPNVRRISVDAPAFTLRNILALPAKQRVDQLNCCREVTLDLQIIAGLCPRANVTVYFSAGDQRGWVDLLDKVIAARPAVLSFSWGQPEDDGGWSENAIEAINHRLNIARVLGITVCASSGDDGSGGGSDDGRFHVSFPGSSPHVLSVGGTMLSNPGANGKEVAWWEAPGCRTPNGGGATGGGVSAVFHRPAWQRADICSRNRGGITGRIVPDVAAIAGPPFYHRVFRRRWVPGGGTSASAPLWAALIARINASLPKAKRQRFLTPLLYQIGKNRQSVGESSMRDITAGTNASRPKPGKGYRARPGFDAVTGWGVPIGGKLLRSLASV
jgi:kumamolisin